MTLSTVTHDTVVIARTYDFPVATVFRAWADPRRKARWFAGSADALDNGYDLDFRVGGREVNRGGPPGGPVYTYSAEFRDIVTDQRIVSTSEMFADGSRISVTVATVEFRESGGTTHLVVTEQAVFLDGHETAAQREEGTRSLLDSLAVSLAGGEP
ncbi:MAG TPA: SRPBCC family protein [Acidothermaceae bacterium]